MILTIYLYIINIVGFVVMAIDRYRMEKGSWCAPDWAIFVLGIIGGCIGIAAAMEMLHPKATHPLFCVGLPILLAVEYGALLLGFLLLT